MTRPTKSSPWTNRRAHERWRCSSTRATPRASPPSPTCCATRSANGKPTESIFLINNAGTSYSALFPEVTEEEFDKLYRVHFKGVFFLTQTLLPLIADGGRIVNVTSSVTRIIIPGSMSYALMKSAVEMWTVYLAKELSARRIAVNAVAPGSTMTDFSGGVVRDDPEVNRQMAEATALGRAGRPEDIGQTIAALLSPENAWITAQRIEASGGLML